MSSEQHLSDIVAQQLVGMPDVLRREALCKIREYASECYHDVQQRLSELRAMARDMDADGE